MTLYYTLVFLLMMFEVFMITVLFVPIPFKYRKGLITFLSDSYWAKKIQYYMKIAFAGTGLLFLDAVRVVWRIQEEKKQASRDGQVAEIVAGPVHLELKIRKFYAQRNLYLCGFTLFLALLLNFSFEQIRTRLSIETNLRNALAEVKALKAGSGLEAKPDEIEMENAALQKKVAALTEQNEIYEVDLKAARLDIETMKKQFEGYQKQYNAMSDKRNPEPAIDLNKKDK